MTTIKLHSWHKKPYGVYAAGTVSYGEHEVPIQIRSASVDFLDESIPKIIGLHGLAASAESMAMPARVAAGMGYAAITLDYSNNKIIGAALQHNSDDVLATIEAMGAGEYRLLGHSMGAAIATITAQRSGNNISRLDLVTPGAMTDGVLHTDPYTIARAFGYDLLDELHDTICHPLLTARMAVGALASCHRRRGAILAEIYQLTRSTVQQQLTDFRNEQTSAHISLTHGSHDKLIPREALLESLAGWQNGANQPLFDSEIAYEGHHTALMVNPMLSHRILRTTSTSQQQLKKSA